MVPVATKGWVLIKRTVETKITADVVEQKVEHAGYHRSIIKRNPRRYDEDGEELDDDDDDSQADAEAALQNPYSEIKLEGWKSSHVVRFAPHRLTNTFCRAPCAPDYCRGSAKPSFVIDSLYVHYP